jgi:hypothetical protein
MFTTLAAACIPSEPSTKADPPTAICDTGDQSSPRQTVIDSSYAEDCDDLRPDTYETSFDKIDDNCDGCVDDVSVDVAYTNDANQTSDHVSIDFFSNPDGPVYVGFLEGPAGDTAWRGEACLTFDTCHHEWWEPGEPYLEVVDDTADVVLGETTHASRERLVGGALIVWLGDQCSAFGPAADAYAVLGCCYGGPQFDYQ